jgi:DNA-binding response OmpR family regulator
LHAYSDHRGRSRGGRGDGHGLTEAGYECVHAPDGEAGLTEAGKGGFDVMIVDRMMPKKNGVEVVETLRREGDQTPVLFLSALGEINDRVVACGPAPTTIWSSPTPSPS